MKDKFREEIERRMDLGHEEGYMVAKEGFDKVVKAREAPKKHHYLHPNNTPNGHHNIHLYPNEYLCPHSFNFNPNEPSHHQLALSVFNSCPSHSPSLSGNYKHTN